MIKTPVWNIGGGIRHGQNLINYFKGLYTAKQLSYIINCFSIPHFERKKHI